MLYAYIDESERNEDFYFLGAVICNSQQRNMLRQHLDELVLKHSRSFGALEPTEELHGSTMMRAQDDPWRQIPLRVRFKMFEDTFRAIDASGARLYLEGVDIKRQIARGYPTVTPARELAFSHLFERINDCGDKDNHVKVIADDHHTREISRSNFTRYRSVGTYGYRSSYLPFIEPQIDFIDSRTERGLQAADMATYMYNRWLTVPEKDERAKREKNRLWGMLEGPTTWPRGRARTWP